MICPELNRRRGARVADAFGQSRHGGVVQCNHHLIFNRQIAPDDPCPHHFAITKDRGARRQSRRTCAKGLFREGQTICNFNHAAGMDDPRRQFIKPVRKTCQICLARDRGEAFSVYGLWVFLVGAHAQGLRLFQMGAPIEFVYVFGDLRAL